MDDEPPDLFRARTDVYAVRWENNPDAGPISFDGLLIQCAGRVGRAAPGKDVSEVHDYHDWAVPIIAASLQRRMPGHRALGFLAASPGT